MAGPIYTSYYRRPPNGLRWGKATYRQMRPYHARLPYAYYREWDEYVDNPSQFANDIIPSGDLSGAAGVAHSKAYASFVSQAKGLSVNVAVNVAERKQTVDIIAKRASQTLRFARALRKFDIPAAVSALNIDAKVTTTRRGAKVKTPSREIRLKNTAKSFGNNFLEFHFGWEPLVKDIGEGLEMLFDTPFRGMGKSVIGRGHTRESEPKDPDVADSSAGLKTWWPYVGVTLRADVIVENANSSTLSRMGFTNPAVIAWELVPFSFVVDWFSNVGQVLSSWSDLDGLRLENAATTVFGRYRDARYWRYGVPYASYPKHTFRISNGYAVYMTRSLGISAPTPVVYPFKGFSLIRGLTAVSLLTQFLRGR